MEAIKVSLQAHVIESLTRRNDAPRFGSCHKSILWIR